MENNYISKCQLWHKYTKSSRRRFTAISKQTNMRMRNKLLPNKNETESNINNNQYGTHLEPRNERKNEKSERKERNSFVEILFLFVNNYHVMLLFIFSP